MAAQLQSLEPLQGQAVARIAQVDISGPSRALSILRYSDYLLVIGCGLGAVSILPDLIASAAHGSWIEAITQMVMVAVFFFAAYTGWRHVGVIDPRVWIVYPWVFASLTVGAALIMVLMIMKLVAKGGNPADDMNTIVALLGGLWMIALSIPGFVCVHLLRRMRIGGETATLAQSITSLHDLGGADAPHATHIERPQFRRGLVYAIVGGGLLLGAGFVPAPSNTHYVSAYYRLSQQVNLLAFFLIVRARRYFQVSADALLAVDKRAPILFLRSFTDDERVKYGNSEKALLDFSLETRLANHFLRFGPFIAIGSPQETVPQPGAARVILSDDEWQSRVLGWMESAKLIVMYCGTTKWVNRELQKIIERGRSTSLILMIPEAKNWRASKRRQDIVDRVQQLREAFRNTEWNEELIEYSDFDSVRAMLFRADGSMVMVRSRSRGRDSYHLAALVAHKQLLEPTIAAGSSADLVAFRKKRRFFGVGAIIAAASLMLAVLVGAGAYVALSADSQPSQLSFKKGEIYFDKPVTQAQAKEAGQFFVDREYFSDDKGAAVRLDRDQDTYRLQFVVNPAYAENLLTLIQFSVMGQELSGEVLHGAPVQVALTDNEWKPLKTAPTSGKLEFGTSELFYTAPVSSEQALATGELLKKIGFFKNSQGASVQLGREQNVFQLRFVVDASRVEDPSVLSSFRIITRAVSANALGGEPVVLHLCDSELHTVLSERISSK